MRVCLQTAGILLMLVVGDLSAKSVLQLKTELGALLPSGRKARLAWLQGCCHDERWYPDSSHEKTIYVLDSEDGVVRELTPSSLFPGGKRTLENPSITFDGSRVVFNEYYTDTKYVINWNGTGLTKIVTTGYLSRYWRDKANRTDWITLQNGSTVQRVNIDKPSEVVVLWNATSVTRPWFTLSEDGTRIALNCPHPRIGVGRVPNGRLVLADTAGGCWPSIAPDNTYRVLYQTPYHRVWNIADSTGAKTQSVTVHDSIIKWATENNGFNFCDQLKEHAWTRWSNHPDYLTFYMNCTNVNPFILRLSDLKWMFIVDDLGPCKWAGNMDMVVLPATVNRVARPNPKSGEGVAGTKPIQARYFTIHGRSVSGRVKPQGASRGVAIRVQGIVGNAHCVVID